ncbi:MAG: hypothetical protein P1P65_03100 [Treponema sp.]
MNNKSIIFFLGLCPLIPAAVHLAEGLLFAVEFCFLFGAGMAAKLLIKRLKVTRIPGIIEYSAILLAAALYCEIGGICFPVSMIGLQSYVYIFAFSYILSISLVYYTEKEPSLEFPVSYLVLLLTVSALRELFVFGTLSIPVPSGLAAVTLLPAVMPLRFWGSSAGILILLGVGLWLYRSFQKGELLPFKSKEAHQ